jgi:hypothetical protein
MTSLTEARLQIAMMAMHGELSDLVMVMMYA